MSAGLFLKLYGIEMLAGVSDPCQNPDACRRSGLMLDVVPKTQEIQILILM